jgi:putative glutamine amidotransferase
MAVRPLIGLTKGDRGDLTGFICAWLSLWLSGARPVAITANHPGHDLPLDGLLLNGGSDIHPMLFQTEPKTGYAYDLPREAVELAWLRRAGAADMPTLGICRGSQLMSVAAGGALHMDLAAAYSDTRYPTGWLEQIFFRKHVVIEPGSRLAAIVGPAELRVNSVHKQAVRLAGDHLKVSARERNGAIQAVEDPSRRFWIGVQFHPEFLFYRARSRAIFRAFVEAAQAYARTRPAPTPSGAPGAATI